MGGSSIEQPMSDAVDVSTVADENTHEYSNTQIQHLRGQQALRGGVRLGDGGAGGGGIVLRQPLGLLRLLQQHADLVQALHIKHRTAVKDLRRQVLMSMSRKTKLPDGGSVWRARVLAAILERSCADTAV